MKLKLTKTELLAALTTWIGEHHDTLIASNEEVVDFLSDYSGVQEPSFTIEIGAKK